MRELRHIDREARRERWYRIARTTFLWATALFIAACAASIYLEAIRP